MYFALEKITRNGKRYISTVIKGINSRFDSGDTYDMYPKQKCVIGKVKSTAESVIFTADKTEKIGLIFVNLF